MRAVGVDLGGTKIAVALVDDDHQVHRRHRTATPEGPDAVLDTVVAAVRELDAGDAPVGVGVPGPVRDGVLETAPNLVGFSAPVPVRDRLAAALGVPVVVENDASAGAVGEWVAGAGRGARFLLGVWLGTGIGGGLVLDGRPYRGAFGGAGELGHMCVRQGGALCGCGRRGCIEAYAGRARMEEVVRVAAAKGRPSRLLDLAAEKGKDRITSGVWRDALDEGDELATAVLDEAVAALGAGVGAAINLLDLDTVVVGGGLAEKLGDDVVRRIAAAVRLHLLVPDADRRYALAALGDDAGVIGAADLARAAA